MAGCVCACQGQLSLICHNYFSQISPMYISDILTVYTPFQQFWSSSDCCILSSSKLSTVWVGFSLAAPKLYNHHHNHATKHLKNTLKMYMFKKYIHSLFFHNFVFSLFYWSWCLIAYTLHLCVWLYLHLDVYICVCFEIDLRAHNTLSGDCRLSCCYFKLFVNLSSL